VFFFFFFFYYFFIFIFFYLHAPLHASFLIAKKKVRLNKIITTPQPQQPTSKPNILEVPCHAFLLQHALALEGRRQREDDRVAEGSEEVEKQKRIIVQTRLRRASSAPSAASSGAPWDSS
jgi:hypothetical protein